MLCFIVDSTVGSSENVSNLCIFEEIYMYRVTQKITFITKNGITAIILVRFTHNICHIRLSLCRNISKVSCLYHKNCLLNWRSKKCAPMRSPVQQDYLDNVRVSDEAHFVVKNVNIFFAVMSCEFLRITSFEVAHPLSTVCQDHYTQTLSSALHRSPSPNMTMNDNEIILFGHREKQ